MDGWAAEGWEAELGRWLAPFLARLRRKAQRHWAPFYLKGVPPQNGGWIHANGRIGSSQLDISSPVCTRGKRPGNQAGAERSLTRSGRYGASAPATPRR